jgi:hypothetical protein
MGEEPNRSQLERLALIERATDKAHTRIDKFKEKFEETQKELADGIKKDLKELSGELLKIRLSLAERKGKEKVLIAMAVIIGGLLSSGLNEAIKRLTQNYEVDFSEKIQKPNWDPRFEAGPEGKRERLPRDDGSRSPN